MRIQFFTLLVTLLVLYACGSDNKTESSNKQPMAKKEAPKAKAHPGKIVYMQFCFSCHMENGQGVPGLYPPLTGTEWVLGEKKRLIETVLVGMDGPIEVNGEKYNNIMTKLDFLSDEQIANVLTYVRSNFDNNVDAVTPAEVKSVRSSLGN